MPVWLSLMGAVFGALGIFLVCYGVFLVATGAGKWQRKVRPRIGILPGDKPGTLGFWASWKPSDTEPQFYRIRVTHWSPETKNKEGVFSITYDPPQKAPFIQVVELPPRFREVLEKEHGLRKALFTVELKDTENATVFKNYYLPKIQKVYQGKKAGMPTIATRLKPAVEDVPTVSTLDWNELQDRKKRMKKLEDEAKAKAAAKAAAAAKPAPAPGAAAPGAAGAKPVTATTPAAAGAKPAAPAPVGKPVTPTPAVAAKPVAPGAAPAAKAAPAPAAEGPAKPVEAVAAEAGSRHNAATSPPKAPPKASEVPPVPPKASDVKPS